MRSKPKPHFLRKSNSSFSLSPNLFSIPPLCPFIVFSVTIIMRFLAFIFLATIFVATAISENLLSDNSADLIAFQDPPQDLLASQNLPENSELTIDDESALFAGSEAMKFFSTEPQGSFSGLEEASCLIEDGQSLNKLSSRDEDFCSPQDGAPLVKEPPAGDLKDIFRKVKEFFGFPDNEDSNRLPTKPPPDPGCRSDFPYHLCCYTAGYSTIDSTLPGSRFYEYLFGCFQSTWISSPSLFFVQMFKGLIPLICMK